MPEKGLTMKVLEEKINALSERVKTLEDKEVVQVEDLAKEATPIEESIPQGNQALVPQEFRAIVDDTLNKSFGIELEPLSGSSYMFKIIVPDKYSTLSPMEKEMHEGKDPRPRVIPLVGGDNIVKEWAETVFSSFSNEIKAQIVADRATL